MTVSERRRKPRQKALRGTEPMRITLQNVPGRQGEVQATMVDMSDTGIGVKLPFSLRENDVIVIDGLPGTVATNGKVGARVACCRAADGGYQAGLAYQDGYEPRKASDETPPDYYELLQVSPNADPEMIHRVFRLLAQRYTRITLRLETGKHFVR